MLRFVTITDDKLELAEEVFHRVFSWMPELQPFHMKKNFDPELISMVEKNSRDEAHLVYDDDKIVGLEGIYIIPGNEESGFLGWFGIVPEERRNHYGARVLKLHEDELRKRGYKFSRLWTDTVNNEKSRAFYESQGYTGEVYNRTDDPAFRAGALTIYSKSLGDYPLEKWNDREIGKPLCGILASAADLKKYIEYEDKVSGREHS